MGSTLDLAVLAATAERLRWRLIARRMVLRGTLAAVGLVFMAAALAMAHVATFSALEPRFGTMAAAAILAGGDLVLALALGLSAARLGPGADEARALAMRQAAQGELLHRGRALRMLATLAMAWRRRG